ncbi:SusE domain-containing protein [Flavihumibacter solisilvae]|uniref:SusE outer membrane protein domain-containing protein n=1 Tax=Flavihumibacter solisilvae TaxID=1349421 RepID=A0A0C1ILT8_9BACT|nr:SusE domain-containing protein [Flavihumibacter solisilvae]KIC95215.1 hypothetical protein OI18_07920 [Flavihumibacter solisilvae]
MKMLYKICVLFLFAATMWSCEKDENRINFEGGTAPVLAITDNAPELSFNNSAMEAFTLNWTNPDYQFTTGVSSHDVSYVIEIDTVGANFTNPVKHSVSISKDLSKSFTIGDFNDILLNSLQLKPAMQHNIEIRVKANIAVSAATLFSNVMQLTATPYSIPPKVTPPSSGTLYIVGSATQGDWSNPVPVPSQQFTQVSETIYEITVNLKGGGAYLFIPRNGEWAKYNVKDDKAAGIQSGGDFGAEQAKDIPGPDAAGNYKITVDFQRGKFTVVKQ